MWKAQITSLCMLIVGIYALVSSSVTGHVQQILGLDQERI